MEEAQRELLINDISELVQAQLVTNTLHGDFRETLEVHMNVSYITTSHVMLGSKMRNNVLSTVVQHKLHKDISLCKTVKLPSELYINLLMPFS